ncbi:gluconate 2-dehydrogenase subunit 3 family protein [Agriterribacter sp.]|uniref:gluconate 2-dehydrogenase subunit 3 family protein n=1 Tax=Agriterribacter sp. TaxID=2821509 RepID=UPI002B80AB2C|nr:gluconate 2-dehydrogenase subunit 3 family protein [Agriterribacter sp.]HRO44980.1 gluconate 2-dehydrogenase subunit 3 family protein [Agriterribacter sp.]
MNRREALSRVALILGGTVVGANVFLEGCKPGDKRTATAGTFSDADIAYLDEIAETIIPTTSTPGAKAAGAGAFMTVMVNDCYDEKDQQVFFEGMKLLNEASDKKFGKSFMDIDAGERKTLLTETDTEAKEYMAKKKPEDPKHYFRMMKELTLLGYFTSEIGATQALRYVAVPGKYEGCVPYTKGDRAWAT